MFWSAVLDQPITRDDPDFVVVSPNDATSGIAFRRTADHFTPPWALPEAPPQMHLDVMVDDIDEAADQVLELGARFIGGDTYSDPAGHPFCLIHRPSWAPQIHPSADTGHERHARAATGTPPRLNSSTIAMHCCASTDFDDLIAANAH